MLCLVNLWTVSITITLKLRENQIPMSISFLKLYMDIYHEGLQKSNWNFSFTYMTCTQILNILLNAIMTRVRIYFPSPLPRLRHWLHGPWPLFWVTLVVTVDCLLIWITRDHSRFWWICFSHLYFFWSLRPNCRNFDQPTTCVEDHSCFMKNNLNRDGQQFQ